MHTSDLYPIASTSASPMYHQPSSSWTTHLPLNPSAEPLTYPTSDVRSTPWSASPRVVHHTRFLPHSSTSPALTSSQNYYPCPVWKEIQRGVWTDGTDCALTAAHPSVQTFLATARRRMGLPVAVSEVIFVIAALEVFYSWNDPVHWMFWSDEQKVHTADVVNRVSLRSPPYFRSKVAWSGTTEYLFILSILHGSSSLLKDKEWFRILNPAKAPPPLMNLRKRKVQQTEPPQKPVDEDVSEIEEPRPKRSKTRPTRGAKPRTPVTSDHAKPNSSALGHSTPITITPPAEDSGHPPIVSHSGLLPQPSTCTLPKSSLPTGCQSSPTPDPSSLATRAGSQSPTLIDLLTLPPGSHTRNRSTSQASSQTLVAERRSESVLSNTTVVEALTGCGEAAGRSIQKYDELTLDYNEAIETEEESAGMVTRGRANKSRTTLAQGKCASLAPRSRAKRRTVK